MNLAGEARTYLMHEFDAAGHLGAGDQSFLSSGDCTQ